MLAKEISYLLMKNPNAKIVFSTDLIKWDGCEVDTTTKCKIFGVDETAGIYKKPTIVIEIKFKY